MVKMLSVLWLTGLLLSQVSFAAVTVNQKSQLHLQSMSNQHAQWARQSARHKQTSKHPHRKRAKRNTVKTDEGTPNKNNPTK